MLFAAPGAWTAFRWICCLLLIGLFGDTVRGMSRARRIELREEVRSLFRHGYDGYLTHAWPADELHPISCTPRSRNWANPADFGINDIAPNASMTLLDTLTSLPIILPSALPDALERITQYVSWDQDVKIQVFELTIRGLGSLLSTYQYLESLPESAAEQADVLGLGKEARKQGRGDVKKYRWKILALARDLAERLMPAFDTPTGIPYARVNLKRGVEVDETQETCTAGAGSLILEFGVLSRLTSDPKYEDAAQRAFLAIWHRRSEFDLLGNTIGALHGQWLAPGMSGVPAGMDSYFEYALKAYILLGDDMYLDVFADAYAAIQTHVRTPDGFIYRPVQLRSLLPNKQSTVDALSAFFPGVQVLYGNVESAIRNHMLHWNLWRRYSGSPESWDIGTREAEWKGWPLRPEFTESTMYLHRATGDDFYLRVGERVLQDLVARVKTDCGFAVLSNVETGDLEDRMESFVLSELLKYLYLLFDPEPVPLSNTVFSTEAHPLSLPHILLKSPSTTRRALRKNEDQYCPIYEPPLLGGRPGLEQGEGLRVGIEQRADWEYGRSLVFGFNVNSRVGEDGSAHAHWRPDGFCEIPHPPRYSMEVPLTPNISAVDTHEAKETLQPHDYVSLISKIQRDPGTGDLIVHDTKGLNMQVRWRLDGKGYDVAKVGPHRVLSGQHVLVADPSISPYIPLSAAHVYESTYNKPDEVMLRFSYSSPENGEERDVFLHTAAATATFGHAFAPLGGTAVVPGRWTVGSGALRLVRPQEGNDNACSALKPEALRPFSPVGAPGPASVILAERGGCTFLQKSLQAALANAAGVLIVAYPPSHSPTESEQGQAVFAAQEAGQETQEVKPDRGLFRPSADGEPETILRLAEHVGVAYTSRIVLEKADEVWTAGGEVWIEALDLSTEEWGGEDGNNGTQSADTVTGADADGVDTGNAHNAPSDKAQEQPRSAQESRREGRMMLGDWEIWNLRVVDPVEAGLEGLDRPP